MWINRKKYEDLVDSQEKALSMKHQQEADKAVLERGIPVGSVVCLKSDAYGHATKEKITYMTVDGIYLKSGVLMVHCIWIYNGEFKGCTFRDDVLSVRET